MSADVAWRCDQGGCPLAADGQCLEGFEVIAECPHSFQADGHAGDAESINPSESTGERADNVNLVDVSDETQDEIQGQGTYGSTQLGGGEALSLEEASALVENRPCTVTVVAGEFESGKTTLIVELYAQFLSSRFGGWTFGGSKTLKALDDRHRPARLSSGASKATTERTQDDDMRLLHLRLKKEGLAVDLLASDVRGEFFENIINGADVADEVPLASRADTCVLVLDGKLLANPVTRGEAFVRARQLIGGLTEPGGLRAGTRLAILCSKGDLFPTNLRDALQAPIERLVELGARRGLRPTVMIVSARPDEATVPAQGMEELLTWLTDADDSPTETLNVRGFEGERYFWRAEVGI